MDNKYSLPFSAPFFSSNPAISIWSVSRALSELLCEASGSSLVSSGEATVETTDA